MFNRKVYVKFKSVFFIVFKIFISDYDHESLRLMYSLMGRVEDGVKPIINGNFSFYEP